jgi:hypothetical protein
MPEITDDATLAALLNGELKLQGEFVWGYNYTFLVRVVQGEDNFLAVYKPLEGEQPLWDFPDDTLAHREVAAYMVSEALGWDLIPPTVFRESGPLGPGSLQYFIEHDPEYHFFKFNHADRQRLRPVALFDILVNNADRKGGHIIFGPDDHLWLIDHGLCFNAEEKLRTVIWDFAGETIPEMLQSDIETFRQSLEPTSTHNSILRKHLSVEELDALAVRADGLLTHCQFPHPPEDRRAFPYPPI